jgi:hypothetical protein
MKGGKTPIHRQPWYPADYHADEHVRLLYARRDWRTLTFYRTFIDVAFMKGGDLPAEPEALAASLMMPVGDVRRALAFCLDRLVFQEDGRLFQKRVRREVADELSYRAEQAALGKKGGETAGRGRPKTTTGHPLIEDRATPLDSIGPPPSSALPLSPPPPPAPFPAPREAPPALPPADRAERSIRLSTEALRTRLYGLITEMADADPEHQDPTELMRLVTAYDRPDGTRVKGVVNAALLTHERLEHSIADAEAQLAEWRAADGTAATRSA